MELSKQPQLVTMLQDKQKELGVMIIWFGGIVSLTYPTTLPFLMKAIIVANVIIVISLVAIVLIDNHA